MPWDAEEELNKAKEETPGWVAFFGILTALIMLVIVLGLTNRFAQWAFGWSVGNI